MGEGVPLWHGRKQARPRTKQSISTKGRKGDMGLPCLEETIYHGVSWRDGTDPTIRVPARAELQDQRFGRPSPSNVFELDDVKEGAQFALVRFGLSP
jgi:hypothetical protein